MPPYKLCTNSNLAPDLGAVFETILDPPSGGQSGPLAEAAPIAATGVLARNGGLSCPSAPAAERGPFRRWARRRALAWVLLLRVR